MATLSGEKIKKIRALQQKKYRTESSLFVVEGEKMVQELSRASFETVEIFYRDEITPEKMSRISSLSSPSPVLAVVKQKNLTLNDIKLSKGKIYIALDNVKDPGNLGTIIRLADWFGAAAVICSKECVELYNPKSVQATMGALFRVPVVYADLKEVIALSREAGLDIVATFLEGKPISTELLANSKKNGALLIMGSESFGISDETASVIKDSEKVLIPAFDKEGKKLVSKEDFSSESLNVATACAVMLSHLRF